LIDDDDANAPTTTKPIAAAAAADGPITASIATAHYFFPTIHIDDDHATDAITTTMVAAAADGPTTTQVANIDTFPSGRVPTEAAQRFLLLPSNEEGFATATATDTYYVGCYRC